MRLVIGLLVALVAFSACSDDDGDDDGTGGGGGTAGAGGGGAGGGGAGGSGGGGDGGGGAGGGGGAALTPCEQAFACEAPELETHFGDSEEDCAVVDPPASLLGCLEEAGDDCEAVADCTRCLTSADAGFCEEACPHASSCGITDDEGQCSIDCSMYAGGFGPRCVYGYEAWCWTTAAAANDCDAASACENQFGM